MTDLDGLAFVRQGNALFPVDFHADEFLSAIPEGKEVLVTIRRPRSVPQHRFFFAMLRKVVENTDDKWSDEEDLLQDLKLSAGHKEIRINRITGQEYEVAKSISFASMGQDAFNRFTKRCAYLLSRAIGINPETLMEETKKTQPPIPVKGKPKHETKAASHNG